MGLSSIPPITSTGRPSGKKFSSVDPIRFRTRGIGFGIGFRSTGSGNTSPKSDDQTFQPKKFQPSKKSTSSVLGGMLNQARSRLGNVMKALKTDFSDSLLDEEVQLEHLIQQLKIQIARKK